MKMVKDLTGNRYGWLTVIKLHYIESGRYSWECLCDCGNTKIVLGSNLKSGKQVSCGCYRKKGLHKTIDYSGQKYGLLTFTEYSHSEKNGKKNKLYWKFRCDCGNEITTYTSIVISGHKKSCGCLLETTLDALVREVYRDYAYRAKKRKLDWNLSYIEFYKITQQECFYCSRIKTNKRNYKDKTFLYNGIDRYDNNIGYCLENVVPCCKICNQMKMDMNFDDWRDQILRIVKKHPTQHAPDAGESAPFGAVSTLKVLSTSQALSTPTPRR